MASPSSASALGDLVAQVGPGIASTAASTSAWEMLGAGLIASATRGVGIQDAPLGVLREAAEPGVDVLVDHDVDLFGSDVGRRVRERLPRRPPRCRPRADPTVGGELAARHDHVSLRRERLLSRRNEGAGRHRDRREGPVEQHDIPGRRKGISNVSVAVTVVEASAVPLSRSGVLDLDHVRNRPEWLAARNQRDRGSGQDGGAGHEADEQHRRPVRRATAPAAERRVRRLRAARSRCGAATAPAPPGSARPPRTRRWSTTIVSSVAASCPRR